MVLRLSYESEKSTEPVDPNEVVTRIETEIYRHSGIPASKLIEMHTMERTKLLGLKLPKPDSPLLRGFKIISEKEYEKRERKLNKILDQYDRHK